MKPDLFEIPGPWRGRLAVMTRPRGGDWLDDEAAGWRCAGLDVVVSLLESDEAEQLLLGREGDAARARGIDFISFPIPDRGVPESSANSHQLLETIAGALENGRNVAVHCRQGVGRAARGAAVPETVSQARWLQQLPTGHPASSAR